MDFMTLVTTLVLMLGLGLPVISPLLYMGLRRRRPTFSPWLRYALACLAPPLMVGLCLLLMWLPTYQGQCGGWLGETSPCDFSQYVGEAVFWAAMSLAVPAVVSVVTVTAIHLVLWSKDRRADAGPRA